MTMTRVYRMRKRLSTIRNYKGDKRKMSHTEAVPETSDGNGGVRSFKAGPGRAKKKKKALRQAIHTLFTLISM